MSNERARTDILEVKKDLDDGKSMVEIAESHFSLFCRYQKSFEAYKNLKAPARTTAPTVIYIWGAAGTGKTRYVMDHYADDLWSYFGAWPFCDGYSGQTTVLFDDFDVESFKKIGRSAWLKIMDRYKCSVQIKGGYVNWSPVKIFITSNYCPEVVFGEDPACLRRIAETWNFNDPAALVRALSLAPTNSADSAIQISDGSTSE